MKGLTEAETYVLVEENGPLPTTEELAEWEAEGILDDGCEWSPDYDAVIDDLVAVGLLARAEYGEHSFFSTTARGQLALRIHWECKDDVIMRA